MTRTEAAANLAMDPSSVRARLHGGGAAYVVRYTGLDDARGNGPAVTSDGGRGVGSGTAKAVGAGAPLSAKRIIGLGNQFSRLAPASDFRLN